MAHALLRLCRGASVHLDGGGVVRLTRVNPNLTETAVGIRSEDDARLVDGAVAARPYDVDCFLSDVKGVAEVAGVRLLDLPSRGLRASGQSVPNCGLALHKLQAALTRYARNVRGVGFGCVARFLSCGLRLFVNRVLDHCEFAS